MRLSGMISKNGKNQNDINHLLSRHIFRYMDSLETNLSDGIINNSIQQGDMVNMLDGIASNHYKLINNLQILVHNTTNKLVKNQNRSENHLENVMTLHNNQWKKMMANSTKKLSNQIKSMERINEMKQRPAVSPSEFRDVQSVISFLLTKSF